MVKGFWITATQFQISQYNHGHSNQERRSETVSKQNRLLETFFQYLENTILGKERRRKKLIDKKKIDIQFRRKVPETPSPNTFGRESLR